MYKSSSRKVGTFVFFVGALLASQGCMAWCPCGKDTTEPRAGASPSRRSPINWEETDSSRARVLNDTSPLLGDGEQEQRSADVDVKVTAVTGGPAAASSAQSDQGDEALAYVIEVCRGYAHLPLVQSILDHVQKWIPVWAQVRVDTLEPVALDPLASGTFRICHIGTDPTLTKTLAVENKAHYRSLTRPNIERLVRTVDSDYHPQLFAFLEGCLRRNQGSQGGFSRNINADPTLACLVVKDGDSFSYLMFKLAQLGETGSGADTASQWSGSCFSGPSVDRTETVDVLQIRGFLVPFENCHKRLEGGVFRSVPSDQAPSVVLGAFGICDKNALPVRVADGVPAKSVHEKSTQGLLLKAVADEERGRLTALIDALKQDERNTVRLARVQDLPDARYIVFYLFGQDKCVYMVVKAAFMRSRVSSGSSTPASFSKK